MKYKDFSRPALNLRPALEPWNMSWNAVNIVYWRTHCASMKSTVLSWRLKLATQSVCRRAAVMPHLIKGRYLRVDRWLINITKWRHVTAQ